MGPLRIDGGIGPGVPAGAEGPVSGTGDYCHGNVIINGHVVERLTDFIQFCSGGSVVLSGPVRAYIFL